MAERDGRRDDSDWIFAGADPGTLPTEQLPGRAEFEKYSSPLIPTGQIPVVPEPEPAREASTADRDTDTDAIEEVADADESAPLASTYARSGTTPNAEDAPQPAALALPSRFAALSWWDAVRDIVALLTLCSAYTVPFTPGDIGGWILAPRIAIGVAVATLLAVHLLRWIPAHPHLGALQRIRPLGMAPAVLVAVGTIVVDAVTSLPVLLAPLPDGPPVGVGVGVALLLVGGMLGAEPRGHEGFVPGESARALTRRLLLGIAVAATVFAAIALVMIIGRALTTGWAGSALVLGDTVVAVLLLGLVIASGLRRERSRYVFSVAAVAALVLGAMADNTLRLQYALPRSMATGYVYLPLLFAAFAVMLSRSFVRSMPLSFRRADWLACAVRALEFSVLMHAGAVVWSLLAALAATGGAGRGGPVLHLVDAVLAALFALMSSFGRHALLERSPDSARTTAVVAAVVMVVVGFLDVIVNSLATGAGAGLVTGGVALVIGIAVALMLTVPAPVRDEHGAPDLARMFEDFRHRDEAAPSLLAGMPDLSADRAAKKSFPRR